jgi:hypothetical protein
MEKPKEKFAKVEVCGYDLRWLQARSGLVLTPLNGKQGAFESTICFEELP